ncbi:MAG: M23 family metallopeptidase, partial [Alistipes sp.]|nr:M23 family metallopeptidase [Alistipes sp.]
MTQKQIALSESPTPARTTRGAERAAREAVKAPIQLRVYRVLRKILIGFILVSIVNVLFSQYFQTPKLYRIDQANRSLMIRYRILRERIRTAQSRVDEIRHRDSYVYRALFSTDTLSIPEVWYPYPDEKYAPLADDPFASTMVGTWKQLDALARTIYLESVSFDELQVLSKDKSRLAAAIPAIWPIDRKALHGNHIGAFNPRRMHPIYHRIIFHKGCDLGCDRGTPVYATGDATVQHTDIGEADRGYGMQILLNHRFGYQTRYAHLSRIYVKPGDKVTRCLLDT